jgi:hypothetical protein
MLWRLKLAVWLCLYSFHIGGGGGITSLLMTRATVRDAVGLATITPKVELVGVRLQLL